MKSIVTTDRDYDSYADDVKDLCDDDNEVVGYAKAFIKGVPVSLKNPQYPIDDTITAKVLKELLNDGKEDTDLDYIAKLSPNILTEVMFDEISSKKISKLYDYDPHQYWFRDLLDQGKARVEYYRSGYMDPDDFDYEKEKFHNNNVFVSAIIYVPINNKWLTKYSHCKSDAILDGSMNDYLYVVNTKTIESKLDFNKIYTYIEAWKDARSIDDDSDLPLICNLRTTH